MTALTRWSRYVDQQPEAYAHFPLAGVPRAHRDTHVSSASLLEARAWINMPSGTMAPHILMPNHNPSNFKHLFITDYWLITCCNFTTTELFLSFFNWGEFSRSDKCLYKREGEVLFQGSRVPRFLSRQSVQMDMVHVPPHSLVQLDPDDLTAET